MRQKPQKAVFAMLHQLDLEELTTLIERANARREQLKAEMRETVRAELEAHAARFGMRLEDVLGPRIEKRVETRRKPKVKYRGPDGETWSGRGRVPRWLAALEAKGQDRTKFKA